MICPQAICCWFRSTERASNCWIISSIWLLILERREDAAEGGRSTYEAMGSFCSENLPVFGLIFLDGQSRRSRRPYSPIVIYRAL